jgi:hypothetical protein
MQIYESSNLELQSTYEKIQALEKEIEVLERQYSTAGAKTAR